MSYDNIKVSIKVKPTWNIIKEIQVKTEDFIKDKEKDQEIIDAVVMCASELIENAVKYGVEKPDGSSIDFSLKIVHKILTIEVENGYYDVKDLNNVIEHIDKIRSSEDPSALYIERLEELLESTNPDVSQLGLYRIVYEGGFSLNYKCEDRVFTIIADREISP